MATTSLWHIKGRLNDLISYVENPAKTRDRSLQDFFNVFAYTQNPDKTHKGEYTILLVWLELGEEYVARRHKEHGIYEHYDGP